MHKGNDNTAFEALKNGEAQFAITDPGMVARDTAVGRIIAPLVTKVALWGLTKNPQGAIPSNAITYPKPSTAYQIVERFLQTRKITASITEMLPDQLVADADNVVKTYDLICVTEPERT